MNARELFAVTPRMIVATIIGAGLFTMMSRYVFFPTPVEGTLFFPSYAILGVFATLFGPISGALISLSGMLLVPLLPPSNPMFGFNLSYTIAAVVCGFIYGLAKKFVRIEEGRFNDRDILAYNLFQVIGNFAAFAITAPTLWLIFVPELSAPQVYMQGLIASFVDILSAEFIGTPLLFVYSRIRKKQLAEKPMCPDGKK